MNQQKVHILPGAILRDYARTEHDDWILNVQPRLTLTAESVELRAPTTNKLVGWKIQTRHE